MKDNLCIFLLEIGGCEIKSAAFRVLTAISLILCSSFLFIQNLEEKKDENSLIEFEKAIEKSLKAFDFSNHSVSDLQKAQGFS